LQPWSSRKLRAEGPTEAHGEDGVGEAMATETGHPWAHDTLMQELMWESRGDFKSNLRSEPPMFREMVNRLTLRISKALSTLSQKSATVAENGETTSTVAEFGHRRTFLRKIVALSRHSVDRLLDCRYRISVQPLHGSRIGSVRFPQKACGDCAALK